eukprot:scaffold53931_cov45-Phaeocystis_antarctica.AAC.1
MRARCRPGCAWGCSLGGCTPLAGLSSAAGVALDHAKHEYRSSPPRLFRPLGAWSARPRWSPGIALVLLSRRSDGLIGKVSLGTTSLVLLQRGNESCVGLCHKNNNNTRVPASPGGAWVRAAAGNGGACGMQVAWRIAGAAMQ